MRLAFQMLALRDTSAQSARFLLRGSYMRRPAMIAHRIISVGVRGENAELLQGQADYYENSAASSDRLCISKAAGQGPVRIAGPDASLLKEGGLRLGSSRWFR